MNEITIVGRLTGPPATLGKIGGLFEGMPQWASFEVRVEQPADRPTIIHSVYALPPLRDALVDLDLKKGDKVVVVSTYQPDPGIDVEFVDRPALLIEAQVIARDPLVA